MPPVVPKKKDDSSFGGFLGNAWDSLKHIYQSVPEIPGSVARGLASLNAAQMEQYHTLGVPRVGPPEYQAWQARQPQKVMDTAHGIIRAKAQQWKDPANYAYTDPFGMAMDVAPFLGAGARALDVALPRSANAARVADVLRAGEKVGNAPLGVPAAIVGRTVNKIRPTLDTSFAARDAAVAKSGVHPLTASHPKVQAKIDEIAANKGYSPEAVKEAVVRAAGAGDAPIPRGTVHGEAFAGPAQTEAAAARANARTAVNAQTQGMVTPSESAVGSDFLESLAGGRNKVESAFRKAYSNEGAIAPNAVPDLVGKINEQFSLPENVGIPNNVDDLKIHRQYPVTNGFLYGEKGIPGLAENMAAFANKRGGIALPELEQFRKGINHAWKFAKGDDRAAISAIRDSFDNWANETVSNPEKFTGDSSGALDDFANARKTHVDFKKTFENSPNPNVRAAAAKALPHLEQGEAGYGISETAPASLPNDIQSTLTDGIIDPKTSGPRIGKGGRPSGDVTYQTLTAEPTDTGLSPLTPKGISELNDHVRGKALAGPLTNDNVDALMQGPYAHIFEDMEPDLRLQSDATEILNAKPGNRSALDKNSNWSSRVKHLALGAGAGQLASTALEGLIPTVGGHLGRLAEEGGATMGAALEARKELAAAQRAREAEMSGADAAHAPYTPQAGAISPEDTNLATAPIRALDAKQEQDTQANAPSNDPIPLEDVFAKKEQPQQGGGPIAAPIPLEDVFRQPHAAGGRTAFASGGRAHVNPHTVNRLTNKLLKRLKAAKKEASKMTEPLLNHSDESIARALSIAAKGI
jgi:hypothetical protein